MRACCQRRCGHTRRTGGPSRTGLEEPCAGSLIKVGNRQLMARGKNMACTATPDIPQSNKANSQMRSLCDNLC